MKQTAVEWFYIEMENLRVKAEITNMDGNDFIIAKVKLLNQAKAMEKEKRLTISDYNLDELAMDYASTIYDGRTQLNKFQGAKVDFKKGFQKAFELLTFKSE